VDLKPLKNQAGIQTMVPLLPQTLFLPEEFEDFKKGGEIIPLKLTLLGV
jgi:hypothetical protein